MTEGKVKRKTFVAREDLIGRLSEIAKQKGFTLYGLVNDIFHLAIQAEDLGVDLRKVVKGQKVLKAAREAGFILGLENVWYDMAELAYSRAKNKALKSWLEGGVWFAKRYVTGGVEDPLEAFRRDLEAFTWNIPEFRIKRSGGEVSVSMISPRLPYSYTFLFTAFLEGALKTFGYEISGRDVARGIIRLKAVRREADA